MNDEEFVRIWNECRSRREVVTRTRLTFAQVRCTAARLRAHGVELRVFSKSQSMRKITTDLMWDTPAGS